MKSPKKFSLHAALKVIQPYVDDLKFESLERFLESPDPRANEQVIPLHGLIPPVRNGHEKKQELLFLALNARKKVNFIVYHHTVYQLGVVGRRSKRRAYTTKEFAKWMTKEEVRDARFNGPDFEEKFWRQMSYAVGTALRPARQRVDRLTELGLKIQEKLPVSAGGTRRS